MKRIINILMLLLIFSCTSIDEAREPSIDEDNSNNGIIIISLKRTKTESINAIPKYKGGLSYLVFCEVKSNECFKLNNSSKNYDIIALKEGTYYLKRIQPDTFNMPAASWSYDTKKDKGDLANFRIKKGDILYLGDLENIIFDQRYIIKLYIYIYILNNSKNAKQYLKEIYPFIDSESMQVRLLELGTKALPMTPEIMQKYGIKE